MTSRIRARRQRQEEDRLRECYPCAETFHKTKVPVYMSRMYLFRRMLLVLGMAVFAIILISAAPYPFAGPGEAQFLAKSDAAMARMMAAMKIKPSNDVDRDFVALMVPHHQGGIDMAQAELVYGHNEALRRLAQEIVVTQQQEIVEMRFALASVTPSPLAGLGEAQFLARNDAAMTRMMAAMKIKPSNDVDRDFVALMVPHHQGGIDMAQAELVYGHNKPLRSIAQEIIATQQQEIAAMRRTLGLLPSPSVPASNPPSSTSM